MWVALLILLLLVPMAVAVNYLIWRFLILKAKAPLGRLREPRVRRDFIWLMLESAAYIGGVAFLLETYLPGV